MSSLKSSFKIYGPILELTGIGWIKEACRDWINLVKNWFTLQMAMC